MIKNTIYEKKWEIIIIIVSVILLTINILEFPIHVRFGLVGYVGQELLRGYPIYSTFAIGHPPVAYFVDAFFMLIFFFLPNYLAVRVGGIVVGIATMAVFYKVLLLITNNKTISLFSVLVLLSFTFLIRFIVNVSFKSLFVSIPMFMFYFLFRDRSVLAGMFGMLSLLTYQLGIVFILTSFIYYFLKKESLKQHLKLCVGMVIPLVLFIIYFWFNGLLFKFFYEAYFFTFYLRTGVMKFSGVANPFLYFKDFIGYCTTEIVFVLLSLVALLSILTRWIRRRSVLEDITNNKGLFVFILPYVLLLLYTFVEIGTGEDTIPLLPAIALGGAFVLDKVSKRIPSTVIIILIMLYGFTPMLQPVYPPNPLLIDAGGATNLSSLVDIMSRYSVSEIVYYSLFHRKGREMNLNHQLEMAEYINDNTDEGDEVLSFGAPELLFLTNKRNMMYHGLLNNAVWRQRIMMDGNLEEIRNDIIGSKPKFIFSWNTSNTQTSLDFFDLRDFLEANYRVVSMNPKYIIWERLE